mgnify:CR=1 FL=1
MDYWWIIGASVVGYLLYKKRINWSLIILIALTIGLGIITGIRPQAVSLPSAKPNTLINTIDLTIGAACSVRIGLVLPGAEGPSFGLPERLCTILGLINAVWGRLPIVLAIYKVLGLILDNWAWFWLIGIVAYIWDEDFGISLVLIPYIAYMLALLLKPFILGLASLGFIGSGIYLTAITSTIRPVAFTGTATGYTPSLAISFNPINITSTIFQWHYVEYTIPIDYYINLPLSLHIGIIQINPSLNYTPITCWNDYCGGYRIIGANTTYTITSLPNGTIMIIMNRIVNRTIWLEAWLFSASYTTNCTGVFRPDYNYSIVNVGWVNSLVKSIDNRTVVPNDSAIGYIQGFLNAYAFNSSCIIRIIGNPENRWIASANYAYTPALAYITSQEDLYRKINSIVNMAIVTASIGALAGIGLEFLTITGILGRVFKLITTRLPE